MPFEIHENMKRHITLSYKKEDGSDGVVDGLPDWSIVPVETSVLTVDADGMGADLAWAGTGNDAVLTVVGDADMGSGVFPIITTDSFNFIAPLGASSGSLGVSEESPI